MRMHAGMITVSCYGRRWTVDGGRFGQHQLHCLGLSFSTEIQNNSDNLDLRAETQLKAHVQ